MMHFPLPSDGKGIKGGGVLNSTAPRFTHALSLPMNLVAADVRRLHLFREIGQSLTSAATVEGFKARNFSGNSHP